MKSNRNINGNIDNGKLKSDGYIIKRKILATIHSLLFFILWLLPIKKNKIVFCAFEGNGGYGCNPKYIADELLRRDQGRNRYELWWLSNHLCKDFPGQIKVSKNTFIRRAYHLATAGIWIDNSRKPYGTRKRKGQTYIQTWHATLCIKPIGLWRKNLFPPIAYLVSKHDSQLIDYVLSGSSWCEHMYRKGLIYNGNIIRTGTPRCDILFTGRFSSYKRIRKEKKLPDDSKIILYAPTFRSGSQNGDRNVSAEELTLDFHMLLRALEVRFDGNWYVFARLHPQLASQNMTLLGEETNIKLIDVSFMPDMNELIAASDILITDYSSVAFEAMLINIPIFIYADDLEEYTSERGKLMFNLSKLPFPVSGTNEELADNILKYSENDYINKLKMFKIKAGIFEDGHASKRVADLIDKILA